MLRCFIRFAALFAPGIFTACLCGGEPALDRYDRVDIAPAKTSIYIGSVTMTMTTFVRRGATYEASYTAKVFPYFFYNETGRLVIEVSDDTLRALERGEPIEFKGRGISTDGSERRIEGKATPANPTAGKIKVRVFVSKRIELIFNTTYRLSGVLPNTQAPR